MSITKTALSPLTLLCGRFSPLKNTTTTRRSRTFGRIYTRPSWVITAGTDVIDTKKEALANFLKSINEGIAYFNAHHDEAVEHISTNLDYSAQDARAWLKTVTFIDDVTKVDPAVVQKFVYNPQVRRRSYRRAGLLRNTLSVFVKQMVISRFRQFIILQSVLDKII